MRIEIINNSSSSGSLSFLSSNLSKLISQSETTIASLHSLKSFSYSMNGGIGLLQGAVDSIDDRIGQEETRKLNLVNTQTKLNDFVELVSTTDKAVSNQVSQNQDEFYRVNEWSSPSPISVSMKNWYNKAKEWTSGLIKKGTDYLNHVLEVYNEHDISQMSDEELQEYYQEILKKVKSGGLSIDDEIRAKSLLSQMSGNHVNENMTESDKKRIKMFNELYEALYPEQAARVNAARDEYENQRGSEVLAETKYQIYSEYLDSGDVSDDFIKHQIEAASKFPKGLYWRVCNAQDDGRRLGTAGSVDEMDSNSYYRQGTTSIYNVQSHKNDDGSVDISFSAANSTKRYTEITVYDSDGNIKSREYLKGQQDPSSISGVFGEVGKIGKDLVSGKAFKVDCESFNSKDDYSYTIPEGGYIKITEDPNEMNRGAYKQQIINSMSTEAVDKTLDTVNVKTGNAVTDFGVDIAKSLLAKTAKDQLNGTSSSLNDYGKEIVSKATNSTIDAITNAGGNPAGLGTLGIKTILDWNSINEENVRDIQQNKSKGNGSLYIYN